MATSPLAQLAEYFENQSIYRTLKAAEYPEDERNQIAADGLAEAAVTAEELSEDDWRIDILKRSGVCQSGPHDTTPYFGEEAQRAIKDATFRRRNPPKDLDGLLSEIIDGVISDWEESIEIWPPVLWESGDQDTVGGAMETLLRMARVRKYIDEGDDEFRAVETLRCEGWSWDSIADMAGVSKQGLWKKYHKALNEKERP